MMYNLNLLDAVAERYPTGFTPLDKESTLQQKWFIPRIPLGEASCSRLSFRRRQLFWPRCVGISGYFAGALSISPYELMFC